MTAGAALCLFCGDGPQRLSVKTIVLVCVRNEVEKGIQSMWLECFNGNNTPGSSAMPVLGPLPQETLRCLS